VKVIVWKRSYSQRRVIYTYICSHHKLNGGPGSSVGIATGYGLDGPGIESRWGEIFRTCPDRPWGPLSLQYNGYRVFPGSKERLGRDAVYSGRNLPTFRRNILTPFLVSLHSALRYFYALKIEQYVLLRLRYNTALYDKSKPTVPFTRQSALLP